MTETSETLRMCSISATWWASSFTTRSRNWSQNRNSFFWDTSSTWFPFRSLQLWIDITNQALICSFLLSQGGCAHMWQILLSHVASTEKMVPLGWLHTREVEHCISLYIGIWMFNQQLVGTSFPHGGWRFPMVEVSTQCSEGSLSYLDRTRHSVVHGCIEQRLGSTFECIDGVRYMDNNRENTSHQRTQARNHTQSHAPLAAEACGSGSPGCIRQLQQGGIWSIQLCRRTKKLLLVCQAN